MKCPKCQTDLVEGKVKKQKDGTEYFKLRCPNCGDTFMDFKIPKSALGFDNIDSDINNILDKYQKR